MVVYIISGLAIVVCSNTWCNGFGGIFKYDSGKYKNIKKRRDEEEQNLNELKESFNNLKLEQIKIDSEINNGSINES